MLKHTKILYRIALSAILPLIIVAALAAYEIASKARVYSEMDRLEPVAAGVTKLSRLVHELQKERGMTSAFLNSKGAQMRSELPEQRKRTDAERAVARPALSELKRAAASNLAMSADRANDVIGKLDALRSEVDAVSIAPPAAVGRLTETIARQIAVITGIANLSTDDDISKAISAYANLIEGKERAGQERALNAGAIAAGKFELPAFSRGIGLAAGQEGFFAAFRASATPQALELFTRTMSGPAIERVDAMRKTIEQGGLTGDLKSLDSKTWFDASTARIDLLKAVEDGLADQLAKTVAMKKADAASALTVASVLMLLALLISGAAVLAMARSITRPIGALSASMTDLANGDVTADIGGTDRRDEIGGMARAVAFFKDNMIRTNELSAREAEEVSRRNQRTARVTQLAGRFEEEIGALLSSLTTASSQLHGTAGALSTTAGETIRQATVVTAASNETSTNVQTVAAAAEELSSSVVEIGRQVSHSATIAQKAVEEAGRTNDTVMALSSAAERIGDVVNLITEIASQTNLLALNATIEAARAGDAGRGFSVVASEVKSLAGQTAKATEEIRAQIAAIQSSSGDAVDAIRAITGTIGTINEIASSIASAVEEQSAATQEIARNVQHAAQGANEISRTISGVTDMAGDTGSSAGEVLSASDDLARQSGKMRDQVENFLAAIKAA